MKRFIDILIIGVALLAILALSGCAVESRPTPVPTPKTPIEEKIEAIAQERDAAIKTSADAREAAKKARAEADAARKIADEKDAEARHFEDLNGKLRNQEIAGRIAIWSWVLAGAGAIGLLVGVWLCLRFPGKTALSVAISGAAALGLGLLGVWIAPHWLLAVWGVAGLAVLAIAGGTLYLLHDHQRALRQVWDLPEGEILKDPRLVKLLKRARAIARP